MGSVGSSARMVTSTSLLYLLTLFSLFTSVLGKAYRKSSSGRFFGGLASRGKSMVSWSALSLGKKGEEVGEVELGKRRTRSQKVVERMLVEEEVEDKSGVALMWRLWWLLPLLLLLTALLLTGLLVGFVGNYLMKNIKLLVEVLEDPVFYASLTSGEAYRDRRLTTNFELWVEIFCVPTCFHMRIPKPCLSVCPHPEKKNHHSFVNISPTLIIDTSMERSSRVLHHGNPKIWFFFSKKFEIRILTFDEELKSP